MDKNSPPPMVPSAERRAINELAEFAADGFFDVQEDAKARNIRHVKRLEAAFAQAYRDGWNARGAGQQPAPMDGQSPGAVTDERPVLASGALGNVSVAPSATSPQPDTQQPAVPDIAKEARLAVGRLKDREGENIDEWASNLAKDLVAAGESEYEAAPPQPDDAERLETVPTALIEALKFFADTPHFKSTPFRHARSLAAHIGYLRTELDAAQSALALRDARYQEDHRQLAEVMHREKDELRAALAASERKVESLTIKTPREQAMRETIHGQALSMRAMGDEVALLKKELAASQEDVARLGKALTEIALTAGGHGMEKSRMAMEALRWSVVPDRQDEAELARLRAPTATGEDRDAAQALAAKYPAQQWRYGKSYGRVYLVDELVEALAAARAQGVREGIEKAAAIVRKMPPGVPSMGADDYDDWTLEDVAQEIERALAAPEPQEEKP